MGKNSNYHRADVALLRAENEALKEKNTLLEKQLAQQTELLQQMSDQMEELRKKLDHMNEVFVNAQRARFGQKSEQKNYVLGKDQLSLFNEAEDAQNHKAEEPTPDTSSLQSTSGRRNGARLKC